MKRIFLSGDPTHPLFHRYQNVSQQLESIFEGFQLAYISEHYEFFETQDYQQFDLAVLYTDHWIDKTGTSPQQAQALVDYVARGGALLVLHNLDLGVDRELAQLLGARLRHPLKDQGGLSRQQFTPALGHPIAAGVEAFTLEEERFAVEYAPFTERQVFLTATGPDGMTVPAGWAVEFGLGRAAYCSPGHTAAAFETPAYRTLVLRAAQWLTGQLEEGGGL